MSEVSTTPGARRTLDMLALGLMVPLPTLGVLAAMVLCPGRVGDVIFLVTKALFVLFPVAWLLAVERGKPGYSPARQGGWALGAATGAAILLIIFAVYFLVRTHLIEAGTVAAKARETGLDQPARYLTMAAYWIVINSLIEEYAWRWFVFEKVSRVSPGGKGVVAVVVTALLFTAHHVVALLAQMHWPLALLASLGVFIGGAVWAWLYQRYRSIWPGYLSHVLADVPIFVIGWWLIHG